MSAPSGTWSAKSTPVADSLQPTSGFANSFGYTDNQPDIAGNNNTIAYTRNDGSLAEKLWHVVNVGVPSNQRPAIINGSNSLWCGKYDPAWVYKVGYPNRTYQILYIDTGPHSAAYHLTFSGNLSSEQNYDYNSILGGGGGNSDPLQNRRDLMSDMLPPAGVVTSGPNGDSDNIWTFTGSIIADQVHTQNHTASLDNGITVGSASAQPTTQNFDITIDADHRAIYWVMTSDHLLSSEDGLWPLGKGQILDDIATSDNGAMYTDQTAVGGVDPFSGDIIKGTYGSAGFISARVPAGVGELWQLAPGSENVTSDLCVPQKAFASDLFFEGGDPNTNLAINRQTNSLVSCTFPIPPGTGSVVAQWSEYLDLPRYAGYVRYGEYRYFMNGVWSRWKSDEASGAVRQDGSRNWGTASFELAEATRADSVQLRFNLDCVPELAGDKSNCAASLTNALLYDDLRLQVTSGTPPPIFGIFVGSLGKTTFVDGTILGINCSTPPCWPGIRGSALPGGIDDNFNSSLGDSITVACVSGLRRNGMGINWQQGFDKSVNSGGTIAYTNASFNSAFDRPRFIYRLFDPATKTWSPFDSSAMDADAVAIVGSPPETTVINNNFRIDWPPRDRVAAAASLPGGFTINGEGSYANLSFLPRGTRIQYYFKTVDINGGTSYQFSSDQSAYEVESLPALPGGSARAPDIIEYQVLPGVYPSGPAGSLLFGRLNTPILNLDGAYTSWSFGYDPVTQALRGLGVRVDRYRFLQGYDLGSNIGGHELPGGRIGHLSNFFPNYTEYPIADSLATWYRIMIQSSHVRTFTVLDEQDAALAEQWWNRDTGSNQGDRCIFAAGDNLFDMLFGPLVVTHQTSLAQNVFGVSASASQWSGTSTTPYPTIDDRFAAASAGPSLAAANTFTYPLDGGCAAYNGFDALTKVGSADAASAVFYPNSQIAGIARMSENDGVADKDRSKAIGYAYSIQFIRDPAYARTNANYVRSGVENRMRVLYKFLTSCRGPRTGAPADTGKCWPCPSPGTTLPLMQADWAGQSSGFATGTWGPLYPIQAGALATAIEEPTQAPPVFVNALLQNRPNPFNPETAIPYSLAMSGRVAIRVFDISGRCVRTLVDRVEPAGPHLIRWNGKNDAGLRAASGVYFYRITYPDGGVSAKKLMIVR